MFFRKYHIIVLKEFGGTTREFKIRGFAITLFVLLSALTVTAGACFFHYYRQNQSLQTKLVNAKKTVQSQQVQLMNLNSKIDVLAKDIARIRSFDSKLQVMMDIDADKKIVSLGGPDATNFLGRSLPVHSQEILLRKMHEFIAQLSTEAHLQEVEQQKIIQTFRQNKEIWAYTPSIIPTKGWETSGFGYRTSPFTGQKILHKGLDISAPIGTPVYAPANGRVAGTPTERGYGISLVIDHGRGITTRYAHLNSRAVKKGQTVKRGDIIAYTGNSGRSTGPHLHYEVRQHGVPVNPKQYILN